MKKYKRLLALNLILMLCLSLAGCAYSANFDTATPLKDQRAEHAVYKDAESEDVILYNGNEYYRLQNADNFTLSHFPTKTVSLTRPNVPVLLREFGTGRARVTEDGRFMEELYSDYYGYSYYCRADVYEEMQARLDKEFVPEQYGYPYYDEGNGDYFYTISEKDVSVLFDVLETVTPQKIDDFPEKETYASPSDLELYGERGFEDEAVISGASLDLLLLKREMYVFSKDGTYYLSPDTLSVYAVPAEHTKMMDALCAKANYWK